MVKDRTTRSRSKTSQRSEEMDGTATLLTPTLQEQQHRPGRLLQTPSLTGPYNPITAKKEKWPAGPSNQAEIKKEAPESAYIQEEPRSYNTGPPARSAPHRNGRFSSIIYTINQNASSFNQKWPNPITKSRIESMMLLTR